jgi:argininosuccinate lyase
MKKLWQKNWQLDKTIEIFETKDDLIMDQKLVTYDIFGSLAHAKGLMKIDILTNQEFTTLKKGLLEILFLNQKGQFNLLTGDEDIHTKIENYLVSEYGEVGNKIHTGRSRNDQVLTAIRLYSKEELLHIWHSVHDLTYALLMFAKKYKMALMPGYSHMQKAMPSTVGMWTGAIIEGLLDDLKILHSAYKLNNQSPLGSAAGYGVPLPLNRNYTAQLLGFKKIQTNPIYCQNSRGKIEATILSALISILSDINKLANDVLLFTTSEFGYFDVEKELCTGSSIMPQKKNVDIAELLRSKVHLVLGNYVQTVSLSTNLPSGYNRDLQDTKKPFIESIELTNDSIKVATILVEHISVNKNILKQSLTPELFATHYALSLVQKGMPFREAYKQTSQIITNGKTEFKNIIKKEKIHSHIKKDTIGIEKFYNQLSNDVHIYEIEKTTYQQKIKTLLSEGDNTL